MDLELEASLDNSNKNPFTAVINNSNEKGQQDQQQILDEITTTADSNIYNKQNGTNNIMDETNNEFYDNMHQDLAGAVLNGKRCGTDDSEYDEEDVEDESDDYGPETDVDNVDCHNNLNVMSPTLTAAKALSEGIILGNNPFSEDLQDKSPLESESDQDDDGYSDENRRPLPMSPIQDNKELEDAENLNVIDQFDKVQENDFLRMEQDIVQNQEYTNQGMSPTPVLDNSGCVALDNVGESGGEETDDDEGWKFFQGGKSNPQPTIEDLEITKVIEDTKESKESEKQGEEEEEDMSMLNPNAAEFVPVSPIRSTTPLGSDLCPMKVGDKIISESPKKPKPIDSLTNSNEFLNDIKRYEGEVEVDFLQNGTNNCEISNTNDILNGHHNSQNLDGILNGKNIDEIEFQPVLTSDNFDPANESIHADISENLSVEDDSGIPLADPMSMSFYQEKGEDNIFNHGQEDLNAVHLLPENLEEFIGEADNNKENDLILNLQESIPQNIKSNLVEEKEQESPMSEFESELVETTEESPLPDNDAAILQIPVDENKVDIHSKSPSPIPPELTVTDETDEIIERLSPCESPVPQEPVTASPVSFGTQSPLPELETNARESDIVLIESYEQLSLDNAEEEEIRQESSNIQENIAEFEMAKSPIPEIEISKSPEVTESHFEEDYASKSPVPEVETIRSPTPEVESTPSPVPEVAFSPSPFPDVVESPSPVPDVAESPSPVPDVAESASPVPEVVESTFTVPEITERSSPVPEIDASPSPVPEVDASPSPVPEIAASPSPVPEIVASPSPVPEIVASPSPVPEIIASPSPVPEIVASPSPVPEFEAIPSPVPQAVSSPSPVLEIVASPSTIPEPEISPSPIPEVEASPSPIPDSLESKSPIPVVEVPEVTTFQPIEPTPAIHSETESAPVIEPIVAGTILAAAAATAVGVTAIKSELKPKTTATTRRTPITKPGVKTATPLKKTPIPATRLTPKPTPTSRLSTSSASASPRTGQAPKTPSSNAEVKPKPAAIKRPSLTAVSDVKPKPSATKTSLSSRPAVGVASRPTSAPKPATTVSATRAPITRPRPTTLQTKTAIATTTNGLSSKPASSSTPRTSLPAAKSTATTLRPKAPLSSTVTSSSGTIRSTTAPRVSLTKKPLPSLPVKSTPSTEKQIKETANKQLSSRTTSLSSRQPIGAVKTTSRTNTTTTTGVRKTETKPSLMSRTTTKSGTTNLATKTTTTTTKKPATVTRTSVTKTNTASLATSLEQTQTVSLVHEITNVSITNDELPPPNTNGLSSTLNEQSDSQLIINNLSNMAIE